MRYKDNAQVMENKENRAVTKMQKKPQNTFFTHFVALSVAWKSLGTLNCLSLLHYIIYWSTQAKTLTSPTLDASLGPRHGEDGEAVIVLGTAGLDGTDVAVAASAEHTWKIQGLHSLRLHLSKHGLTHCLKLTVYCVSQLQRRD